MCKFERHSNDSVLISLDTVFVISLPWAVWQAYCQVEKLGRLREAVGQTGNSETVLYVLNSLQIHSLDLPLTLRGNNYRQLKALQQEKSYEE